MSRAPAEPTAKEYRAKALDALAGATTDGNTETRATLAARRAQTYATLAVSKATEEAAQAEAQRRLVLG